jgi:hypothetical protein
VSLSCMEKDASDGWGIEQRDQLRCMPIVWLCTGLSNFPVHCALCTVVPTCTDTDTDTCIASTLCTTTPDNTRQHSTFTTTLLYHFQV